MLSLGKEKILIAILLWSFSLAGLARVRSVSARSGMFSYSQSGIIAKTGESSTSLQLEWCYYNSFYDGTLFSYKRVIDNTDRTLYQAFSSGIRYYPLNGAYSTEYMTDRENITYDYGHTVYTDISLSFGRYLISVFGNPPIYDLSSDFIGISAGAGWAYQLTTNFSIDLQFNFGYSVGFNSPVVFNATDTSIMLGVVFIYGSQRFSPA